MPDRVRPLKVESPGEGGTQDDSGYGPVEVSIGQDFLDSQGCTFQRPNANTATADAKVYLTRDASDNLNLADSNAGLFLLGQLISSVSGRINSHNALPSLEHFSSAPGDGFASGAYMTVSSSGVLPTSIVWFASSASGANRLFSIDVVYKGIKPQTITQKIYTNGAVARTFVDTLTYANVFYPTVTRTWT